MIHDKVHIFWEGHKILRNLPLTVCTVVKSKGKISQNFVAFSEYMNFIEFINVVNKIRQISCQTWTMYLKADLNCSLLFVFCNVHNDDSTKIGHNFNPFARLQTHKEKTTGLDNENNKNSFYWIQNCPFLRLLDAKAR